jgi:hypothetical protein
MATRDYVVETRKQRELLQAEFIAANSPNIFIESLQEFFHRTETIMGTEIRIHNYGASIGNSELFFALLCCEKIEDILRRYNETTFLSWSTPVPPVRQNRIWGFTVGIYDQDKKSCNLYLVLKTM